MPYTHVEIEQRKTRTLAWLFAGLVLLYAVSTAVLVLGLKYAVGGQPHLSLFEWLLVIGIALLLAWGHWAASIHRLVDRTLVAVSSRPLDPEDAYHGRLKNIIDEVSIATGGRAIEPYVISTGAMNACAIADFSGRSAIAVTEGLLARLSRPQLEAVVGHEAAHIASGDSLSKSVFCGLFGLHEEALKRLCGLFEDGWDRTTDIRGLALLAFVMIFLWVTTQVKRLFELCVSREQEYRADAVAVKLTRDPLSLAEALHLMSRRWRGIGTHGESLSTIFTMDTGEEEHLSEQEGLAGDLFSTHPPTRKRLEALLGMAHVDPAAFEQAMSESPGHLKAHQPLPSHGPPQGPARWLIREDGVWKGPWTLDQVGAFAHLLTPEAWVQREGDSSVKFAWQDSQLLALLRRRYGTDHMPRPAASTECPNCHLALSRMLYEGVPVDTCPACRGGYVKPDQLTRIFLREDYAFPEAVKRLAQRISSVNGRERIIQRYEQVKPVWLKGRRCPQCQAAMARKFYSTAYLVEVEQCWECGLTWLDHLELEVLQYLYEEVEQEKRSHGFPGFSS
ncbi:MAG: M48 family metalloprotease [Candidatus Omnitrophica bacterium]|nr:M48 family metalloprotease [Candidatus Omnitrophota bacterium]